MHLIYVWICGAGCFQRHPGESQFYNLTVTVDPLLRSTWLHRLPLKEQRPFCLSDVPAPKDDHRGLWLLKSCKERSTGKGHVHILFSNTGNTGKNTGKQDLNALFGGGVNRNISEEEAIIE